MVILYIIIGYFLIGIIITISILVYDNLHDDPYYVHKDNDIVINTFMMLFWPAFVAMGITKLMIKASDSITDIIKSKRNK